MTGLACLLLAAAQQTATFEARIEAVYVDAFVTRKGVAVTGLTSSDFELKDNGIRQSVELAAVDAVPVSAVLVLDTSGSVAGETLASLQVAGRAFLDGLRAGDDATLLTFSHEIRRRVPPTRDLAQVRRELNDLVAGGHTALWDALYAGLKTPVGRARAMLVLFTDGQDNLSVLGEEDVLAVAVESDVLVHVVGLGGAKPSSLSPPGTLARIPPRPEEPDYVRALRRVAEATGGRFWEAASPGRLKDAFAAILESMKTRYVLRYEPEGVVREGPHRVEVWLRGGQGEVRARRAYTVVPGR